MIVTKIESEKNQFKKPYYTHTYTYIFFVYIYILHIFRYDHTGMKKETVQPLPDSTNVTQLSQYYIVICRHIHIAYDRFGIKKKNVKKTAGQELKQNDK